MLSRAASATRAHSAASSGALPRRIEDVGQLFIGFPPTRVGLHVVKCVVQSVEPPLLHRPEGGPAGVGQQGVLQRGAGLVFVRALENGKDIVRVGGDNALQTEVFQQGAVAVRHVDTAQGGKHFPQHTAPAALHGAAGAGGADVQHPGCGAVLTGNGALHPAPHLDAVGLIVFRVPGEPRADLQHPQIVLKAVHLEISGGNARAFKGIQQLHVRGGIAAGQDKIRLAGEQPLQAGLFHAAQVGYLLAKLQVEVGPCVPGGGDQRILSSGETPDVGKAADEGRGPFWSGKLQFPAQVIGKGHCFGIPAGDGGGLAGRLGAAGEKRGEQERSGTNTSHNRNLSCDCFMERRFLLWYPIPLGLSMIVSRRKGDIAIFPKGNYN